MPVERLKKFLDEHRVKFVTISHSQAFTAHEVAAAAHVPGKEVAKTVMVKLDGDLAMVVLPATDRVSIERVRAATGAREGIEQRLPPRLDRAGESVKEDDRDPGASRAAVLDPDPHTVADRDPALAHLHPPPGAVAAWPGRPSHRDGPPVSEARGSPWSLPHRHHAGSAWPSSIR